MKVRGFLLFAVSIWVLSCIASPQISAFLLATVTSTSAPVTLPVASSTPIPTLGTSGPIASSLPPTEPQPTPSTGFFELIGHSPLIQRGMNAALAIYGNYAYIGSRTDGSHPEAGVLVVDISNPTNPQVVYQIGPPDEGITGQTSRELRVWPDQELLIVMNFDCEAGLHECQSSSTLPHISFYDISVANAAQPTLIARYVLPRTPHEFFLWDDPAVEGRALLYISTPGIIGDNLLVLDISQARAGVFRELSNWTAPRGPLNGTLHSLGLSVDGRRAYLAYLRNGFMILDTSDLAANIPNPQLRLLTPPANWPQWSSWGPHSAVKLFGKPYVLVTEEVYGQCPWGWASLLDITDEARPQIVSEYKVYPYNTIEHCAATTSDRYWFTSFSAHNPTLTKSLAFITWHSGGLQVFSIENPLQPSQVAQFLPEPLPSVYTEDPALSSGPDQVVMWSYPIIKDGLIYAVDIRNGLYILRYHGPFEAEVAGIRFLEGNSNLGEPRIREAP
jgi:hypothetical protein